MTLRSELFRHRSSILLLLVWPVLVWTLRPGMAPLPEVIVGAALVAVGGALRLASARCLGRGARVHRADARGGLVQWGPYAWSRNPLYVAAACILAGVSLLAGAGWWGLLMFFATYLVYLPIILHEEIALRESVGSQVFDEYVAAVPRWLGLPRNKETEERERSPWSKVLKREKGLIPGLIAAVAGVLLVRADILPLRSLVARIQSASGLPAEALVGIGIALGALVNSVGVERKRRKHDARRRAQAEGPAQDDDPASEPASSATPS